MKKLIRDQYDKTLDKIKANIAALKPYLENIQKASTFFLLKLVIVVVVAFSVIWLGKFTWRSLTNRSMFIVSPLTFSFETPDWVTDKLIHEINNIPGLRKRYNLFEKGLTKKIAGLYKKSPLISKVYYVKRELPNKLNLKFELFRPIAIIKRKGKEYLVNKDCVRLPDGFYKYPEEGRNPIYIVSKRTSKVPEYGKKWNDNSIEEGVKLLNYLKHNKVEQLLKIATIDVSNIGKRRTSGKSDIIIRTANGTAIKWGCPPSCGQPDELSNYEKLQNLLSVAMEEGTGLINMEYVDVRWSTPLARRSAERHSTERRSTELSRSLSRGQRTSIQ